MSKEQIHGFGNFNDPQTFRETEYVKITDAERYGLSARGHSQECNVTIGLAVTIAIIALLIVVALIVVNLPLVNGEPIFPITGWLAIAILAVNVILNIVVIGLLLVAKGHHEESYELLLKRERTLPKETPVLVKMI